MPSSLYQGSLDTIADSPVKSTECGFWNKILVKSQKQKVKARQGEEQEA